MGIFFLVAGVKSLLVALRHRWTSGNVLMAPLAVYVVFNLAYSAKGFVLDTDPGNIFFWLALGTLVGLDQEARRRRTADQDVITDAHSVPAVGDAQGRVAQVL